MRWADIERDLRNDLTEIHRLVKNTAPQNSQYYSFYWRRLWPHIIVSGKEVSTNTHNLYNSVMMKEESIGKGKDMISTIYVDDGKVPYYDRAVMRERLPVRVTHRGYRDYDPGSKGVRTEYIKNRNYLYYMKAKEQVFNVIRKWDNKVFKITDSLEVFR